MTRLLHALSDGDPHASEQLLPIVYDGLRRLAREQMRHEHNGHTLQPTALVHEAYLRLLMAHPCNTAVVSIFIDWLLAPCAAS